MSVVVGSVNLYAGLLDLGVALAFAFAFPEYGVALIVLGVIGLANLVIAFRLLDV